MDPAEWRLIPIHGELEEIKCVDIPKAVDGLFFLALRFWKRYKKYGVADWRNLTIAQDTIIGLFDSLADKGK